jgi:Plavaka transposase
MIAEDPVTQGSMFVPIILGSDKTTVSVATGHTEYWPVYLSIGNIHNNARRAHKNGLVLLGFLAIPKSKCSFILGIIQC